MKTKQLAIGITLAALTVGGAAVSHFAGAQADAPPPGGPGGAGARAGGFPFRGFGGGAIAATGDAVYVLRGNTVFRLDPKTLSVDAQKDMPMPAPMPAGARFRGGAPGDGGPVAPPPPAP